MLRGEMDYETVRRRPVPLKRGYNAANRSVGRLGPFVGYRFMAVGGQAIMASKPGRGKEPFVMIRRVIAGVLISLLCATAATANPGQASACSIYDGAAFGLCNAFCEAMDCEVGHQGKACGRVLGQFQNENGGLPICIDEDGDGVADSNDNCPSTANSGQWDDDGDQVGNLCDNCPSTQNPGQEDADGDGTGDACAAGTGSVDPNDPYYDRFEGIGFDNACLNDSDAMVGGCSGEVCAVEPVFTTCELLPYLPPGNCTCNDGTAEWTLP